LDACSTARRKRNRRRARLSLRGWNGWRAARRRNGRARRSSLGWKGGWRLNRSRRRGRRTGQVCGEWLRQRLEIRRRIGKGWRGSGNTPVLKNREECGASR
jgi:hypothetical protein